MSVTVIDFEFGDTMEITSPDEVSEINGEKRWHVVVWREYPAGSERRVIGERTYTRIGRAVHDLFGMLYNTVSSNAVNEHYSEIERTIEGLAKQDPEGPPPRRRQRS